MDPVKACLDMVFIHYSEHQISSVFILNLIGMFTTIVNPQMTTIYHKCLCDYICARVVWRTRVGISPRACALMDRIDASVYTTRGLI